MRAYPFKVGDRYGHWELLREVPSEKRHRKAEARCVCGRVKVVNLASVRAGQSRSCGTCRASMGSRKHGAWLTTEYRTWNHIRQRCSNPNNTAWANYGGRGIRVCDRWQSFEAFLGDVGLRPSPKHSLERIDNESGYEPGNCCWATMSEQARNRRNPRVRRVLFLLAPGRETELSALLVNGRVTDREIATWIGTVYFPQPEKDAAWQR